MSHPSDGSMDEVTVPSDPLVSRVLDGRYRLESLLGQGGMGAVYRAVDTRLDRSVAVKILRGSEGADETRFASEVRTLARFAHPHLVRLFDAGETESRAYLVMELIEGPNLAKRMSTGPLSLQETGRIGYCVASALAYVHSEGIIHRDVKPANILLDQRGDAHLTDFGIAQLVDTTGMTATGMTLGTPAYLAPEQAQGAKIGPPADIYALGLVLLECLTGRRAFEGTASEVAAARLLRAPAISDEVDVRWREIIRQMTARRPSDRFTAERVVKALADLARDRDVPIVVANDPWMNDTTVPVGNHEFEDTVVLDPTAVVLAPMVNSRREQRENSNEGAKRRRRYILMGLVALGLVGLLVGLASAGVFSGSTPKRNVVGPPRTTTTTKPATTTTSTTTTTTTSTTLATTPVTTATGDVISAINTGVSNGDVPTPVGNQLTSQLQPLVAPSAAPATPPQIQAFDQFASLVSQYIANGTITGNATVNALTNTTNNLATALGTSVPTTTTTTLPTGPTGSTGVTGNTGAPPGPGNGNGH